jgi:hypothetical protein
VLLLGIIGNAHPVSAAEATLDTIRVNSGGELSMRASGFGARQVINSWVSGTDGSVITTENAVSTQGGAVYLTIKIGRFWQPGLWAITILGSESGSKAIATFEIVGTPPDGTLISDRAEANPSTRINFRGAGFTPGEIVKGWVTQPDGTAVALPEDLRSDGSGNVYFSYDVPTNGRPGMWFMTAYGLQSQRLLVGAFTVLVK